MWEMKRLALGILTVFRKEKENIPSSKMGKSVSKARTRLGSSRNVYVESHVAKVCAGDVMYK